MEDELKHGGPPVPRPMVCNFRPPCRNQRVVNVSRPSGVYIPAVQNHIRAFGRHCSSFPSIEILIASRPLDVSCARALRQHLSISHNAGSYSWRTSAARESGRHARFGCCADHSRPTMSTLYPRRDILTFPTCNWNKPSHACLKHQRSYSRARQCHGSTSMRRRMVRSC